MRRIMVINPKGGSGKSTLACNLAGYYASWGGEVALADMDNQKSALSWLRARPQNVSAIKGVSAGKEKLVVPSKTDCLVIDTPAAISMQQIPQTISHADTLLIPVLPSPVDIQAASLFIYQLLLKHKITSEDLNIAVIANRVRTNTLAYKSLTNFIETLRIPFISTIRDSSNYLKAAEKGLCIFDMKNKSARRDMEDWAPLTNWLASTEGNTVSKMR